jgi:sugar lactone lactonase YvrE
MHGRAIGFTALLALACALAAACGGGGGHDTTTVITRFSFPQGFLPVLLEGTNLSEPCQSSTVRTAGDVVVRGEGDLFAVAQSSDVFAVSRTDGSCRVFAHASGATLLSIVSGTGNDARLFAGDDAGRIWAIAADGSTATVYQDTGSGQPITGLVFAPSEFGGLGGSLLAAAGTAGVLRITISDTPAVTTLAAIPSGSPGGRFVDLAFSPSNALLAILAVDTPSPHGEIDTVSDTGTVTTFQSGFVTPVGMAVDSLDSEIYVADAGDDILKTVPVAGGAPTRRARYDFDPSAPVDGITFDGIATLAWISTGPLAIRGSTLPRINPASTSFGLPFSGPKAGYGDLELDRGGAFVLVANDEDDPASSTDTVNNYLFSVTRDATEVGTLKAGIGTPPEQLFAVAIDPVSETIYFSGFSVNAAVQIGNIYKRDKDGTVSLLIGLTPGVRVLGLEIAPPGFGSFGHDLVATTADGRIFAIDPMSPSTPVPITLSPPLPAASHLVDLVFASTGELYAVENNETTSRILRISSTGTVTNLSAPTSALGLADGIEIDEGARRLLVTSQTAAGFQLLQVSPLTASPVSPATVTALAGPTNFRFSAGFFPTGVVYDRLGTVVYRSIDSVLGDTVTELGAVSVAP